MSNEREQLLEWPLEEYRALRAESLQCAQIATNTTWIGFSAFVVTVGGAAAVVDKVHAAAGVAALLVLVQSVVASVVYLSELWKYARIGRYIRYKLESPLISADHPEASPLFWEHWIANQRASWVYVFSLATLQLPVLSFLLVELLQRVRWTAAAVNPVQEALEIHSTLWPLWAVAVVDVVTVLYLGLKLTREATQSLSELKRVIGTPDADKAARTETKVSA